MPCPESNALPGVQEVAGKLAVRGTSVHGFMYRIAKEGPDAREAALADIPADDPGRRACEEVPVDIVPLNGHHEPAFTWNPDTGVGRLIGENIDRRYEEHGADRRKEFVGSADFFGLMADKRGLIIDYKTGRPMAAKESWQLKFLAVAAAAASGAEDMVAAHLVVRGGSVFWDMAEWDSLALAGFAKELRAHARKLRALPDRLDSDKANVVEGDHCTYCPAFNRCPAKVGLVRQMALTLADGRWSEQITVDDAARIWTTLDRYDAIAKRLRAQVEKFAELAPVDLGNGYELRVAEGDAKERVVKPAEALRIVAEMLDEQAAREASSSSKKGLSMASRAFAKRTGQNALTVEQRLFDALRKANLIEEKAGEEKVREVRR